MAIAQHKIGDQQFTFLSGPPENVRMDLEITARPGAPGVGIYRTGIRGRPITVRSDVDLEDKPAALERWDEYLQMIGQDPVDMIWHDLSAGTNRSIKVVVLNVQLVEITSLLSAVGGINVDDGDPCTWLSCGWDLIPLASS